MEVHGEEDNRSKTRTEEGEDKEVHYSLLGFPCSAFHKTVQAILRCLGLESPSISPSTSPLLSSSSSPSEDPRIETGGGGFIWMVTRLIKRIPRPPYSGGRPGQVN